MSLLILFIIFTNFDWRLLFEINAHKQIDQTIEL